VTLDNEQLDQAFLAQVQNAAPGRGRALARGEVLYWQGDPVEAIFVVQAGSLKEYTLRLPD